jgi:hypothetical protein
MQPAINAKAAIRSETRYLIRFGLLAGLDEHNQQSGSMCQFEGAAVTMSQHFFVELMLLPPRQKYSASALFLVGVRPASDVAATRVRSSSAVHSSQQLFAFLAT